jgi:hypothetical protein
MTNEALSLTKKLLTPEQLNSMIRKLCANQHRNWFAGGGTWPKSFGLGAPTEADMLANPSVIRAWVHSWTSYVGAGDVRWIERQWARRGREKLPSSVTFADARQVFVELDDVARWDRAKARAERLAAAWPVLANSVALSRHFDALADYGDEEISRLESLIEWLVRHPNSRLFLRQLPVEGVDTKWFESRRAVVGDLVATALGRLASSDLYDLCGLRRPTARVRLRILCPKLRAAIGGLCDVEAPIDEIARLTLRPTRVLVVENLQTGLALPDLEDIVSIMKLGKAVSLLNEIPWLGAASVLYWGDIDTHGFDILDTARIALPSVRSVLMDQKTLVSHRHLCVTEPTPIAATLPRLTASEQGVFQDLVANKFGTHLRLEQERLVLAECIDAIERAFANPDPQAPLPLTIEN